MSENPFADWVRERPAEIQKLMIDWPPEATVRAKPGVVLMVPAPGVEGTISSWFESGTLGVDAPLLMTETSPATGETLEAGTTMHAQEVRPDQLELVSYAEMPDGTIIDPDYIRAIVEAPPERPPFLNLRGMPTTRETAIANGKVWLAYVAKNPGGIEGGYEVAYEDPTGAPQTVTIYP